VLTFDDLNQEVKFGTSGHDDVCLHLVQHAIGKFLYGKFRGFSFSFVSDSIGEQNHRVSFLNYKLYLQILSFDEMTLLPMRDVSGYEKGESFFSVVCAICGYLVFGELITFLLVFFVGNG
jgi:hypothetical protein